MSTHKDDIETQRLQNETYYHYNATVQPLKVSSRYDRNNPNKDKLGTFDGVFIPTALNVLSILMFVRFGFILGQLGIICTLGTLLLSYTIDLLTTLSVSAIATNGTVRGGGAYYMISRSLGPEFGGSIGFVFFLGQVFNSGMNAVGVVEPLIYNLGNKNGVLLKLLPEGHWPQFLYASFILLFCLAMALVGSQMLSKAGNLFFILLTLATLSIPASLLLKSPFDQAGIAYSGPSWATMKENLLPRLTKGAAGSLLESKETYNDLFGVLFPATAGIFAGAGMSSELRKPSKSIPKGTLWGLLFTFFFYAFVIISLGISVKRETFYHDLQVIQSVNSFQWIILIGEMSTSLFSIIVGMVGAAFVLKAIVSDEILPGLKFLNYQPHTALLVTWILTQLCLFGNINNIATLVTMTFLITFMVMNLACFLLEISSAPNFRPSFKYFNRYTAGSGTLLTSFAMVWVDGITASALILGMCLMVLFIHYVCPPKPWGDVSQSLIYHQVRKYLLKLRQDNIKYWRPQILLLVDDPNSSWNLIKFCNHLKKGGLYILGHVTVTRDFQSQLRELNDQRKAWFKIRDVANIKAFIHVGTGPDINWGIRNIFVGSGLGGMRPNITVVGFYQIGDNRNVLKPRSVYQENDLNTNSWYSFDYPYSKNEKIKVTEWVQMLEDLSLMQSNIAVARNFEALRIPTKSESPATKSYIDLYPIQICGTLSSSGDEPSILTSNFDTYTLILQFGAILITVPEWKKTHTLRVVLFVEKESERQNQCEKMYDLLTVLRIEAELVVLSLDQFRVYRTIVQGSEVAQHYVDDKLSDSKWWKDLCHARLTKTPLRRFSNPTLPLSYRNNTAHRLKTARVQKMGVPLKLSSSMPGNSVEIINDYESELDSSSIIRSFTNNVEGRESQTVSKKITLQDYIVNMKSEGVHSKIFPVFSSSTLPPTKVIEEGTGESATIIPFVEDESGVELGQPIREEGINHIKAIPTNESLINAVRDLTFNDLPSRAQYLILNDMMKQISSKSNLIFTSLPVPSLGTYKSSDASVQYTYDINMWLDGLPPSMLINSQTMTVTTAL